MKEFMPNFLYICPFCRRMEKELHLSFCTRCSMPLVRQDTLEETDRPLLCTACNSRFSPQEALSDEDGTYYCPEHSFYFVLYEKHPLSSEYSVACKELVEGGGRKITVGFCLRCPRINICDGRQDPHLLKKLIEKHSHLLKEGDKK